ncbi:hypothetical protein SynSYN20_03087 [Synechococcus sp. SYN20]|nr:hypothetical protein SynSYN20_03087 [Synechococcus sp. SYN20]
MPESNMECIEKDNISSPRIKYNIKITFVYPKIQSMSYMYSFIQKT